MVALTNALLLPPLVARAADSYDVTYSGGVYSSTDNPHPPTFVQSNSAYSDTVTASASPNAGQATSYSASCGGPLTATFKWSGPDPAPAAGTVLVEEDAEAKASAQFDGNGTLTGVCNSGMGQTSPSDAVGRRYTLHGGSSFSVSCTPSAKASGSSGTLGNGAEGTAYVKYSVSASPFTATISLIGTTPDSSGNANVLIGQGCKATVSGFPSIQNPTIIYKWTVGGTTFQSWAAVYNPPVSSAAATGGFGDPAASTAHWYWTEKANTETVSCKVTLTPPAGQGSAFSVTATKQVNVWEPTYACTHGEGDTYVIPSGTSIKTISTVFGHGETWFCNVQTPLLFGTGGSCNFSQPITAGRTHTYPTTSVDCTENGKEGLDSVCPYGAEAGDPYTVGSGTNAGWHADNSSHRSGDSPATATYDAYGSLGVAGFVSVNESFKTYLMYLPPGADVQPVPLHKILWNWTAVASKPSGGWANTGGIKVGTVTATSSAREYTHPNWTILEGSGFRGTGW